MNKKGQSTIMLMFILVGIIFAIMGFIIVGIISSKINSALDQNITIGQVNLQTENAATIGKFNEMVVNNADFWGLAVIFGMIIGLFLSSYLMRNRFPKFGVILDIFVILVAFIISLYLKAIYSSVVVALSSAGENFAITSLPHTNFFILNLPIFVPIIGVVMIILFHAGIPQKSEELNAVPQVVTG